jgi:hypothetical protein
MNVHLMAPSHDFRLGDYWQGGRELLPSIRLRPQLADETAAALMQDLALDVVCAAMGQGDTFLEAVALGALLEGTQGDKDTILYRQAVLRDCIANSALVREIYAVAAAALESEQKVHFGYFSKSPDMILRRAVEVLQRFVVHLRRLHRLAREHGDKFASAGFGRLLAALQEELGEAYLGRVEEQLHALVQGDRVLVRAALGTGNKGGDYQLCSPAGGRRRPRVFAPRTAEYSFTVAERDLTGARALTTLRDEGIDLAANALAQASDHIQAFFQQLRTELAFYLGCLNLQGRLGEIGASWCLPVPAAAGTHRRQAQGLYDVGLALVVAQGVVANDLAADGCPLVMITGANQGGKSTFLRSIGLAQLMMQAGMPVGATAFCAAVGSGVFTHFRRQEDARMNSGKLDEELGRMSAIVDRLRPGALLLCNESFAATNEREGSAIAREIMQALVERGIDVCFVTHLYALARSFYAEQREDICFLRAERRDDGVRTFRLEVGEPLPTGFGQDLYARIFGDS